jgi:Bromodomain
MPPRLLLRLKRPSPDEQQSEAAAAAADDAPGGEQEVERKNEPEEAGAGAGDAAAGTVEDEGEDDAEMADAGDQDGEEQGDGVNVNAGKLKVRFRLSQTQSDDPAAGGEDAEMAEDVVAPGGKAEEGTPEASAPGPGTGSDERLPLQKALTGALNALIREDRHEIFYQDVSDEDAPQYSTIIAQPMSLSAIQRKLRAGTIDSFAAMRSDLLLICANALEYNPDDSIFYQEAKRVRREGLRILGEWAAQLTPGDMKTEFALEEAQRQASGAAPVSSTRADSAAPGDPADSPSRSLLTPAQHEAEHERTVAARAAAFSSEQLAKEQLVTSATILPMNIGTSGRKPTAIRDAGATVRHAGAGSIADSHVLYRSTAFTPLQPVDIGVLDDQLAIESVDADEDLNSGARRKTHATSGASVSAETYSRSLQDFVAGMGPAAEASVKEFLDELTGPVDEVMKKAALLAENRDDAHRSSQVAVAIADKKSGSASAAAGGGDSDSDSGSGSGSGSASDTTVPISRELFDICMALDGDFSTPRGLASNEQQAVRSLTERGLDTSFLAPLSGESPAPAESEVIPPTVVRSMAAKLAETQSRLDKNFQILCYLQMAQHSRGDKPFAERERQQFAVLLRKSKLFFVVFFF